MAVPLSDIVFIFIQDGLHYHWSFSFDPSRINILMPIAILDVFNSRQPFFYSRFYAVGINQPGTELRIVRLVVRIEGYC